MRLINVKTFKLCEIPKPDDDLPYAILSHTWGKDEVTFQEFLKETSREGFSKKDLKENTRYSKIVRCCAEAEVHGFDYVWIDTCCIDKTSSSELSEAINSMYQWYKQAPVCYAYLSDVESDTGILDMKSFENSRWFRRGWTLQELIAPLHVVFFDRDWSEVGTKRSLQHEISDITGVPFELLAGREDAPLGSFCIAQRMSWAANRRTTRDEDIAYCLMGIFDVNMPILYGEGGKAFIRLQEEILKRSDDQSLFAWVSQPARRSASSEEFSRLLRHPSELDLDIPMPREAFLSSVLATSPVYFKYGQFVERIEASRTQASSFSLTNNGLLISLPLIRTNVKAYLWDWEREQFGNGDSTVFLALLGCKVTEEEIPLAIILLRHSSGRYIRIVPGHLSYPLRRNGTGVPSSSGLCQLYIDTSVRISSIADLYSPVVKYSRVKLLITNCTVVEYGTAYYGSLPNVSVFFALRIKSGGTGLGDTMVILSSQKNDRVKLSCLLYQPTGSASFRQALLGWWKEHKAGRPSYASDFMESDRATLLLKNDDNITVSVDVDADPPFCVVIKYFDQQPPQSRTKAQAPVPEQREQDPRAYREMQKRHEVKLADWTIFSQEISRLPPDKRYLGLELK